MPVKHWSFAGLILTYWCNARCTCCYLCCSPQRSDEMSAQTALALWQGLAHASPHGCRIHLTGGEAFGDWPRLIDLCRRAFDMGLSAPAGRGPLEKVETNAFWATDEAVIRDRLTQLNQAGMGKLAISADPYHQQFVPIERCRRLARVAIELLGVDRVQVRWRDWLADGYDTHQLSPEERSQLLGRYAQRGRERWNGRAAQTLAPNLDSAASCELPRKMAEDFADNSCRDALLRSRHVHVDSQGRVFPGTCAGIVLGRADLTAPDGGVAGVWKNLNDDFAARPIVGVLAESGPWGLLRYARSLGFDAADRYLGKCHLCWHVRRWLQSRGLHASELGPDWMYQEPTGAL